MGPISESSRKNTTNTKKNIKRPFSLLEVMIGIALLLIASGTIGWQLHKAIEKKRFTSHLERLKERLIQTRLLAANMQSDWKGVLHSQRGKWVFESYSLDESKYRTPSLQLGSLDLYWNREKIHSLEFLFTSSGEVLVKKVSEGALFFSKEPYAATWVFPTLFQLDEGHDQKKPGPQHPKDR